MHSFSTKQTYWYLKAFAVVLVFCLLSIMMLMTPLSYSEPSWANFKPKRRRDEAIKTGVRSFIYPRRSYMGACKPVYGRVMILVMYSAETVPTGTNARTMECYASLTNYTLVRVDVNINERITSACSKHKMTKFRKYCAAAEFLRDTDWMLVVDDNTAVVNPNHCIEEWIDDRVSIIFYEQFSNWAISDENYLVRHSKWSIQFLQDLAEREFQLPYGRSNYDKGTLLAYLVESLVENGKEEYTQCQRQWSTILKHDSSLACGRLTLGYNHIWPGAVRIYRKAHGWARYSLVTSNFWCASDFLLHDWQESSIENALFGSPYEETNPDHCALKDRSWKWLPNKQANCSYIREDFQAFESMNRMNYPKEAHEFLKDLEVWSCYPGCEKDLI